MNLGGIPAAPTILFVVSLLIVIAYWMLRDRSAFNTQADEIKGLRDALTGQAMKHAAEIAALNTKVDGLTAQYDEQRSMKHKALNDVAKTVMALDLVQRLAAQCTCGVLDPLKEIVDRLVTELSTLTRTTEGGPRG